MMKTFFLFVALMAGATVNAQHKLIGKWQPVLMSMGNIVVADIKADSLFISDTIDVMVKDDKDPAASKELIQMIGQMMMRKMKITQQEFLPTGEYVEINTSRNTSRKGTYTFDESGQTLITEINGKASKFSVSFRDTRLVLTGELESGNNIKGELVVEFEKL